MALSPERQKALEELLGKLENDAAFVALEDRAHDAGHLEDDDYAHLIAQDLGPDGHENLRRHVLFCEVCSEEFLRRALPEAEREYEEEDGAGPSGVGRRRLLLGIAVAVPVIAGLAWWLLGALRSDPAAPPSRPPGPFPLRAFFGRALDGDARDRFSERIFLRFDPPRATPIHLYVFLLSDEQFTPIHPEPAQDRTNPVEGALVPTEGWRDVEGEGQRHLLIIEAQGILAPLETEGDRQHLALELDTLRDRGLGSGSLVDALLESLRGLLLTREGRVWLISVEG